MDLVDNLFLSVGAMKAGTTWMYQILDKHPEIYFSPEKEIHYFAHMYLDDEFPLKENRRLSRAQAHVAINPERNHLSGVRNRLRWTANFLSDPVDDFWYRSLFIFRSNQTWCADFSNLYCQLSPSAWQHIRLGTRRLRVIYTMRDPIKRLWSHAKFHAQFSGNPSQINSWTPTTVKAFLQQPFLWKHGEYGASVRRLRESLDPSELRLYFFEHLHLDKRGWITDVEDFLEIRHIQFDDGLLDRKVNESSSEKMPDWFPNVFHKDVERIYHELRHEGLEPPESWLSHFK